MKIVAASIVRNEEKFIKSMVNSISWVDELVILDDHCTDGTISIVKDLSKNDSWVTIDLIKPFFNSPMIQYLSYGKRDVSREIETRNLFLDYVFDIHKPNAVVLIDGDELMSKGLKPQIEWSFSQNKFDGIALTCNHIFDKKYYLNVFEGEWNGVKMVDPHVRVLFKKLKYRPGEWVDTPDCMIKHTEKTLCLDGPYHYHLKYCLRSPSINYSLKFLPGKISENNSKNYLQKHRYSFPKDLTKYISEFV